jgi:predicted Zn-dependent protease
MAKGQLGQFLTVAVGVGAGGNDDRGRNAQLVAAMVNQMSQLRFSRGDESESDHYGLKYMAESGYDPSAMLDVMKILKKAGGDQHPPEFLATHPLPETRLEEIRAQLQEMYPNGIPSNLTKGRALHPRSESARNDEPPE